MTREPENQHIYSEDRPSGDLTPGRRGGRGKSSSPARRVYLRAYRPSSIYFTNIGIPIPSIPEIEEEPETADRFLVPLEGLEHPGKRQLEEYVRYKYRRNYKKGTLRNTVQHGKEFLKFLSARGNDDLSQLHRKHLEAFVEQEQDRGLKPVAVKTKLGQVNAFVNFLIKEEVVDRDVLSRKIRIKVPNALPRAIDDDDVNRLLSVLDVPQDRAMILLLLRTGMRIGELLNLKERDIDMEGKKITLWVSEKNQVGRVVHFSDDAAEALKVWMDQRDPDRKFLFYAQGKHSLGYAGARMRFMAYLAKAGLTHRGYSLHRLRHTFATGLLNAGMHLEHLQPLLGHSSVEVTRRYARLSDITVEKEYFRAMKIIEKGAKNEHYQLDHQLQEILEEKKLLSPHDKELPEHP